jgi:hypothetical protein
VCGLETLPVGLLPPRKIAVSDCRLSYSENMVVIHVGLVAEMTVYCIVSRAVPAYGSDCVTD